MKNKLELWYLKRMEELEIANKQISQLEAKLKNEKEKNRCLFNYFNNIYPDEMTEFLRGNN